MPTEEVSLLLVLVNAFNADTGFGWPPAHATVECRVTDHAGALAARWPPAR